MFAAPNDEASLAQRWTDASPFPHVVIDDFVAVERLDELLARVDEEPVERYLGDIFTFEATAPEPITDAMREVRAAFAGAMAPFRARVTKKAVTRAAMRAYAYHEGHYLLPHADHQLGVGRVLAYAYYLPSPDPPVGGELELFACTVEEGEIVRTESALVIEARANRLVVFEVSDVSLHQVREVMSGLRLSLAGWFYP